MATKHKPTIRAVWLGQELRKMRNEVGLSVREMGGLIHLNQANVSKLENGVYPFSRNHVESYLRICGVDSRRRRGDVLAICDDVLRRGWWDGFAGELAAELMDRIWLESKATHIDSFEPAVIPGLLQTTDYARAVMRAEVPNADPGDLARWQEARTTRQLIIVRHEPITFRAIIDESAIVRTMVEPISGRPQLQFLADAIQRSNIDIRILPRTAGLHASLGGSFEVLTLAAPYPEAGLLNTPSGEVCVEGDKVEYLKRKYHRLLDASLTPQASRRLILSEVDKH